jgi:hypothetical protein
MTSSIIVYPLSPEVLCILMRPRPDLILLDLNLPREVLARIKRGMAD